VESIKEVSPLGLCLKPHPIPRNVY
jgi:hypothetical protein